MMTAKRLRSGLLIVLGTLAACDPPLDETTVGASEQALYDCNHPTQRLTCAPPDNPDKRYVCHATGSATNPYNKISTAASSAHTPGVADGQHDRADQAPGASADDLGGGAGLDCDCNERICQDVCTGGAAGEACDDGDRCTGDGTCGVDACELGVPTCIAGTPVDVCTVVSGACDGATGECATEDAPAGTPCGGGLFCDRAGACGPGSWPGPNAVSIVDGTGVFGTNLSGLFYEPATARTTNVLWAVRNGPSTLFRLVWNGSIWTPETGTGWDAGRTLRYPGGGGGPDAEDVTRAELSSSAMYVVTERSNLAGTISRQTILRYDTAAPARDLSATHEWNLTAELPAAAPNVGLEAITWVPDQALVAGAFFDERAGHAYVPSSYPGHGTGLFFVGAEATGTIYVYALDHVGGGFTRIATIASGTPALMAISFVRDTGYLWAHRDNTGGAIDGNQVAVLALDDDVSSPTFGRFTRRALFQRPSTLGNLNNEGIAFAPESQCVDGLRPYLWADDGATGGHSLRADAIPCGQFIP